ncbi:MAG: hypothetical protein J5840_07100 [Lachnospiraceae bacterium]|nr:hypothetical protein [Lachnospiraceae bacterium]
MTLKIKLFAALISLLIISLVFGVSVKSYAKDKRSREYRESVEQCEEEYTRAIRDALNDYGFKNAGISLTKTFDEKRNISYKLVINHHSFEYADESKLNRIEDILYETSEEYLNGNLQTCFSY